MINCSDCGALVSERAPFCPKCGAPLSPTVPPQETPMAKSQVQPVTPQPVAPYTVAPKKESDISSVLLLIFLVLEVFAHIVMILITTLDGAWYYGGIKWYMYWATCILSGLIIFLPACAIKDKTLKIIGLIIASIWAIWWTLSSILHMTRVW